MRNVFSVILVIFAVLLNILKKKETAKDRSVKSSGAEAFERTTEKHEQAAERWRALSEQKRTEAARPEQWRAAKRQQDDAEQVHSVRMDACESKLESLRVLYEAGILDREEYAQRVTRVKAQHARNAGR